MPWKELLACLPEDVSDRILLYEKKILEIRMRAGQRTELVLADKRESVGETIGPARMRKIVLSMMEYSYHTRESELSKGFFTMKNGCRVGVSGTFVCSDNGRVNMRSIGSICIRIAREIKGCAEPVCRRILESGRPVNTLICSSPGLGKTTLLRDIARILSDFGYTVGIADERHEIAACIEGVPTLDVGQHTDVIDGCPKGAAMEMLLRSMAPQILITDEIGNKDDLDAIRESVRRGVTVIASTHAGSIDELRSGPLNEICAEKLFDWAVILKGEPGHVHEICTI